MILFQMIVANTAFGDLDISDDGMSLLQEAISELNVDQHNQAKKVIKDRLLEIKRLEAMLAKARADLAKLLQCNQSEIIMLEGK